MIQARLYEAIEENPENQLAWDHSGCGDCTDNQGACVG